jgi:cell cycle sensor histidine kinase DivJ
LTFIPDNPTAEARERTPAGALAGWSAAWLAMVALAALALLIGRAGMEPRAWQALAAGAAPAVAGLLFGRRAAAGLWLVVAFGAGGMAATLLTGGLTGPLAFWCMAALAAAAATGELRLAALGGALALLSGGVAALAAVTVAPPALPPWTDFWLRLLSLATVGAGLGAGVVLLQRRAVRQARQSLAVEAQFDQLLSDLPFQVVALDGGGRVRVAYGAAVTGLPAGALTGRRLIDLAGEAETQRLEAVVLRALRDGEAEARFTPVGGEEPVWMIVRRVKPGRVVAALRSYAAQAAREAELEQARADADARNAGKSRFLANMSHELRTPLNAIMGFSDIMRAKLFGPLADKYAEYADLIHESGGHLLDLINDVLDMSKIEAERFELAKEEFDAREAVTAVLRLMRGQADRARVQLRGVLPKEPVMVDADRRALKQITLNLISNALKFTPAEGQVTVTLETAGEAMELVVADTGAGIAPEDLQRIGRPYEQAGDAQSRAAGTGLGLSLVRAFAELHGGGMVLESRLGEGTTVTVRLPVLLEAEAPVPPPAAEPPVATIH